MYSPFPITRRFVIVIVVFGFMFLKLIETTLGDFRTDILFFNCSSSESGLGGSLVQNFGLVMANLSALVNQNGFAIVDLKTGSLHGFALSQCFGDLNSTDCSLCFSEIRSTLPRCYPKVGGRLFFDGCFGRYESYNFFDQYVDSIESTICSSAKSSSQSLEFLSALNKTLGRVQSSAPSSGGFSVYARTYSNNITVSALGQCWRNLDRKSCSACLLAAASSIVSCSPALEGRSLYAGCYLRYSDRVFWDLRHLQDSSGVNKIVWISVAVCSGGFMFATAIFIRLFRKKRCRIVELCFKGFSVMELPPAIAFSKLNFKYNVLRKATDDFNLSNKLGQGSNGSVYKGVLRNGREVAVKRLFLNTRQWVDQFFNEVDLISQVHHKNLVKLLGCSLDGPESLLVYEYYFNKSLDFFIFDADLGKILDWKSRVEIIQGVAEGLCYLHEESEVRVVHRDIKASNILLDDFLKPKITDFGLARSFNQDETHVTTGLAGTLGYMAPEYILHGHLTEKADVYSFGILLLEIVTGKRCSGDFGMIPGESLVSKVWKEYKMKMETKKKAVEIMDDGIVEDGDEDEFWRMVHIGLLCTQAGPGNRPSMRKVVEFVRMRSGVGDGGDENVPTKPPFLDVLVDVVADGVEDGSGFASTSSAPVLPKSDCTALVYGR